MKFRTGYTGYEERLSLFQRRGERGLTTIEFLGCATAIAGGIWLGLLYMGFDVQHLAHTALSQAELLEKLPEDLRPAPPPEKVLTRQQLALNLRSELGTLQKEIASLRASGDEAQQSEPASGNGTTAKDQTLAYWRRLSEIALNESMFQQEAEVAFDADNAANVFAVKGRISRFAAKSVEGTPSQGADPIVVQFGQQLREWYDRAGELYEKAVQIWESPSVQMRAQLSKEWRRSELHHRNEARLLHERATAVRGALSRRFGADFPNFATPAAATRPAAAVETATSAE